MTYKVEMRPGTRGPEPVVVESAREALSQYVKRRHRFGPQVVRDDNGQEVMLGELHRLADAQDKERRHSRRSGPPPSRKSIISNA